MAFELRLLGPMVLSRDREPIALPPSKKTRALLAFLAATGKPQRRERLGQHPAERVIDGDRLRRRCRYALQHAGQGILDRQQGHGSSRALLGSSPLLQPQRGAAD